MVEAASLETRVIAPCSLEARRERQSERISAASWRRDRVQAPAFLQRELAGGMGRARQGLGVVHTAKSNPEVFFFADLCSAALLPPRCCSVLARELNCPGESVSRRTRGLGDWLIEVLGAIEQGLRQCRGQREPGAGDGACPRRALQLAAAPTIEGGKVSQPALGQGSLALSR